MNARPAFITALLVVALLALAVLTAPGPRDCRAEIDACDTDTSCERAERPCL